MQWAQDSLQGRGRRLGVDRLQHDDNGCDVVSACLIGEPQVVRLDHQGQGRFLRVLMLTDLPNRQIPVTNCSG